MSDEARQTTSGDDEVFTWHPKHQGIPVASLRNSLATEIASDQRAYALTLEGAEEHEGDSLTSVLSLERKWGPYDLNWAEMDPGALADRIVAFERERERRQELFPFAEFRLANAPAEDQFEPDRIGSERLESPVARGVVVLIVLLILILLWFFLFR